MSQFPTLKSGAVLQDLSSVALRFGTHAVSFLDGSAQRFRTRKAGLRRWAVRLSLLTDDEVSALAAFLAASQGRHGTFTFFDPIDGIEYPNCSLESDANAIDLRGHARGSATVWIRQNWS